MTTIRPLQELLDATYADFEKDANEGRRFGSIETALRWNQLLMALVDRDQTVTDLNFGQGYRLGQAAGWDAGSAWGQEREQKFAELAGIIAAQATEIANLRRTLEPSAVAASAEDTDTTSDQKDSIH